LGKIIRFGLPDLNAETWDMNRHENEGLLEYLQRVFKNEELYTSNCCGMYELSLYRYQKLNSKIKTHPHTYYFSHATGNKKKLREKQRDILKEPN